MARKATKPKNRKVNEVPKDQLFLQSKSDVISFFLVLLATVFPLILTDAYFNILETKYITYCILMITMSVIVSGMLLYSLVMHKQMCGSFGVSFGSFFANKNDIAVVVFWLCAVVSTLQSDHMSESFWGAGGRYSGLFLLSIYTISYLIISRNWIFDKKIITFFTYTSIVVMLLAVTDYFRLDLLGLRTNMVEAQKTIFISTLGNINTFTAFVSIVVGLSTVLFAMAEDKKMQTFYGATMALSFIAIMIGMSDNAYLSLAALFVVLPLVLFRNKKGVLRYMVVLATFVTAMALLDFINTTFAGYVVNIDSIMTTISNVIMLPIVAVILWAIVAAYHFWGKEFTTKILVKIWLGLIALGILALVAMFIDVNVLGNTTRYGILGAYLEFNDSWGSNRGIIWASTMEVFMNFSFVRQLIGFGPDTYQILIENTEAWEFFINNNELLDNAHNEYLHYLVTLGLVGVVSYIVFIGMSIFALLRQWKDNIYAVACGMAVLCYAAQGLVNLSLPIATPIMWAFLAIGIASINKNAIQKK